MWEICIIRQKGGRKNGEIPLLAIIGDILKIKILFCSKQGREEAGRRSQASKE